MKWVNVFLSAVFLSGCSSRVHRVYTVSQGVVQGTTIQVTQTDHPCQTWEVVLQPGSGPLIQVFSMDVPPVLLGKQYRAEWRSTLSTFSCERSVTWTLVP